MFNQLNIIVRDMDATLAFYRALGLTIDAEPGDHHVEVQFPSGMSLEFDDPSSVSLWDSGWSGGTGGAAVLGFDLPSREAVDHVFARLTQAGHRARQRPYDAFWGGRYAIIEDPDGNPIGLMSPVDPERKVWPPDPPPSD